MAGRVRQSGESLKVATAADPPPLKWSDLKYVLWHQGGLAFGVPQQKPSLGDVVIFWRGASSGFNGHVGLYVGEDAEAFHVLGGNQSDRGMIKRIAKNRLLGARRCPWRINQPAAVRPVVLAAQGALSTNEA